MAACLRLPVYLGQADFEDEALTLSASQDQLPEAPVRGRRARLQRAIEVAVSLGFLALALRGIDWAGFWQALRHANYLWLIPGVLLTVALLYLKGWRWQLLFYPEYRLPFSPVMTALCTGYLVSNVFPARAGEFARLVLLCSEQPVSAARTLSTIIVERLLDLLTLIVLLAVLLPFVQLPAEMARVAQVITLAALVGSVMMVLISFRKDMLLGWARTIFGRIRFLDRPQIYDAIGHLIDGFAALRGRLGLPLIGLSLLGWVGVVGIAWSAAQAVHLQAPITAPAFAVVVTTLGMLLPSTPGYIGVFHGLVVLALVAPFGVSQDQAMSLALLWHATNYLTLSVSGLVALSVHGTSLGQVMLKWKGRK